MKPAGFMILHQQLYKQRTDYQSEVSRRNSHRMKYKIVPVIAPCPERPAQHGKN